MAGGLMPPPSQMGGLRQRRVNASPEKFDKGEFEPLQLQALVSTKKFRANDGTPRAVKGDEPTTQRTQLTATLDKFSLISGLKERFDETRTTTGDDSISTRSGFGYNQSTQLTPGFGNLILGIPTAYAIPISAIPPTPKAEMPKKKQKKPFSLIAALCSHNEILMLLTSYLNIPSLISLYSISKAFHHQFNCHYTAQILSIMRTLSPGSDLIFPWRCYQTLCIKDPRLRQKSRLLNQQATVPNQHDDLRDVPSIRWLQMVTYRHGVCTDLLLTLASHGHRCPKGTLDALKRLWFLLDLPTSHQRSLTIHSKAYFPDQTLHYLTLLFLKIDMHFTRPAGLINPHAHPDTHRFPVRFQNKGFVGCDFRRALLAERSLTPLWRVIRGWTPDPSEPALRMDRLDVLKLWVRHEYRPSEDMDPDTRRLSVMDVPWYEVGAAGLERIGEGKMTVDMRVLEEVVGGVEQGEVGEGMQEVLRRSVDPVRTVAGRVERKELLGVDDLVMMEGVRRELSLWEHWVSMMVWGWFTPVGKKMPILTKEQLEMWAKVTTKEEMKRFVDSLPAKYRGGRAAANGSEVKSE